MYQIASVRKRTLSKGEGNKIQNVALFIQSLLIESMLFVIELHVYWWPVIWNILLMIFLTLLQVGERIGENQLDILFLSCIIDKVTNFLLIFYSEHNELHFKQRALQIQC